MKTCILRYVALPVITALMLAVCWPCTVVASAVSPEGISTLDVCSKEKGAVPGADLTISEPIYAIPAFCSTDAHQVTPSQQPESVVASPLERPPAA